MFISEYEKYKKYINDFYPESYVSNSGDLNNIHHAINKNISFIKTIKRIDRNSNDERIRLFDDFHLLHLRVLYHLPSNDEYVNNILIRAISENILRLTVSMINKESTNIIEMSYSTMISKLEEKGFSRRYNSLYQNLTNYFGQYSKDVHGQTIARQSEQEYLTMIRRANTQAHLQRLLRVYNNIFEDITPFFLKEMSIKRSQHSVGELSAIINVTGEEIYYRYTKE